MWLSPNRAVGAGRAWLAPGSTLRVSLLVGLLFGVLVVASAQWQDRDRWQRRGGSRYEVPEELTPTLLPNFSFARVQFTSHRMSRRPGWSHDYPQAERNLLQILREVSAVHTESAAHTVVSLESPDIMRFPVLYFSEPGEWAITPEEAKNFKEFLLRGGFAIFDDFDGPWDWENLEYCMAQVLPGYHFEELSLEDPVFHSFFSIETLDMVAPYGASGDPVFYGIKDDSGWLRVVANYNNDIGDYWEWSNSGFYPIDLSNEGYKFGINYIIYALMH